MRSPKFSNCRLFQRIPRIQPGRKMMFLNKQLWAFLLLVCVIQMSSFLPPPPTLSCLLFERVFPGCFQMSCMNNIPKLSCFSPFCSLCDLKYRSPLFSGLPLGLLSGFKAVLDASSPKYLQNNLSKRQGYKAVFLPAIRNQVHSDHKI